MLTTLCWLLMAATATAQSQQDSTFTYVTGEGTFIRLGKADGAKFNIYSTVQPGVQYTRTDSAGTRFNTSRMSLNLVRVGLRGTAYRDKISFGILTDFTGTSPILEGWIGINVFNKNTRFILGQKQTNTNNRLALEDERYAQVMGQSIAGKSNDGITYGGLMQNFVGATREGGIFFETKLNISQVKFYPSLSVTTGEGQNFFDNQANMGFKYGGRLDIMPLGDFIRNNAFIAHDLYNEPKPRLALGVAASYNRKAASPTGSDNPLITNIYNAAGAQDFANYRKLVADLIFKYRGFSIVGEYTDASVSGKDLFTNAGATSKLTPEVASTLYRLGDAFNIQSSYVFKSKWVIDARYSKVHPEYALAGSLVHKQEWYTAGINRYLKYNAIKAGINVTYIKDATPLLNTKKWIAGLALQVLL
jgi:hypothetical protein